MKQLFFLLLVSVAATHEEVREEKSSHEKRNIDRFFNYKAMYMYAYNKPKSCTSDAECLIGGKYCDSFGKKTFCGCRPGGMKCSHDRQCCSADCIGGKCQCSKHYLCSVERKDDCCDGWECAKRVPKLDPLGYKLCQKING